MNTTEPLTITVQADAAGQVALLLGGPCDYETVGDLRRSVDEALAALPAPPCLTVDFSAVENCDSSGLSTLIWIKRCTDADGVGLHVTGLDDHLQRVMQVTGLDVYLAGALDASCDHTEGTAAPTAAAAGT